MHHTWRMLDDLALGRGRLDRLAELRGDAAWFARACADESTFIVGVDGGNIAADGTALRDQRGVTVDPERAALIGGVNGQVFIALMGAEIPDSPSLREIGAAMSDDEAAIATAAVALDQWHRKHTHCPQCGAPTRNALAGWERHCTSDGTAHYPRTDPAVIVVITDADDRLLLARQRVWPERRFSLVAGYVEPGETAENAVAREVLEEVGLVIGEPEYLGSQPWPFPASLMLCYSVQALGIGVRVDGVEIAEALWVTRAELREKVKDGAILLPSRVSIARRGIEHWLGSTLAD